MTSLSINTFIYDKGKKRDIFKKNLNNSFCFVLFLAVKPQSKDGDENNSAASLTSMTFHLAISSIVAYLVL